MSATTTEHPPLKLLEKPGIGNVQLSRVGDSARLWDWSFDVSADEERPVGGPDDERSRVQALIATRVAEGLRNYFKLSGTASVTR